ncbi:coproporphyrinogen dehydrogenase HemZ [Sulfoacidibacillus thermotolerans]|uniref:Coproporphyrinogen dehydrogenase HemZ n=1 Tax=Sulfoacidibacillus thermotolerans TaxID=1765684 RepID=A0A2U3D8Z2_SULT2|nr:coproporphyrinogen dehydrogenase HemZ [Sulfoacidibacillus thermotolerans]PWI57750.1 coproporphyrinogen dehydrogenase HemZ [Sulfoacidibacillus thermotolerans]
MNTQRELHGSFVQFECPSVILQFVGLGYEQEAVRMINLFFPVAAVTVYQPNERSNGERNEVLTITVDLSVVGKNVYAVASVAVKRMNGTCMHANGALYEVRSRSLALAPNITPVQTRRLAKRAMLYALHESLAAFMGRGQPWGILTGVRPGKLAHALLQRETSQADATLARELRAMYRIDETRARLLVEIAQREVAVVPDLYKLKQREVSVYIGIPFCPTHCAYCTFPAYSMVDKARYADRFLPAMAREIRMVGKLLREYQVPVTTVYIGGGTPTSLKAKELGVLLEQVARELPGHGSWREFCVEAGRADTITPDRVTVLKEFGVDRVSVNPQSFRAQTLKMIGRGHSPEIVDKRFLLFREAGFTNINMDLILGLPGETKSDVAYSIERTLQLAPDAITVHTLSFKRAAQVTDHREQYAIAEDMEVFDMMNYVAGQVIEAGYLPYYLYRQKDILANLENIGYAKPGKEGIYNICIIEEMQTIIGIGGGAASKWVMPDGSISQHQNASEPSAYIAHLNEMLAKKELALRKVLSAIAAFGHLA